MQVERSEPALNPWSRARVAVPVEALGAWCRRSYPWSARIALSLVYFWFGMVKAIGKSQATPLAQALTQRTIGLAHFHTLFTALAMIECVIGVAILIPRLTVGVLAAISIHMGVVCAPLVLVPDLAWQSFLVPTLEGQYIIKNLLVVAAVLAIGAHRAEATHGPGSSETSGVIGSSEPPADHGSSNPIWGRLAWVAVGAVLAFAVGRYLTTPDESVATEAQTDVTSVSDGVPDVSVTPGVGHVSPPVTQLPAATTVVPEPSSPIVLTDLATATVHLPNDPAVGAFALRSAGVVQMGGRVSDEPARQRLAQVLGELSPGAAMTMAVEIDPAAPAGPPILVVPSSELMLDDLTTPRPEAATVLAGIAAGAASHPEATLSVYVHADASGDPEKDTAATVGMGEMITTSLVAGGIDMSRLRVFAVGSAEPLADDTVEGGRAVNRRVEFVLDGIAL